MESAYDAERDLIRQKLDNILEYYETIEKYYDSIANKFDAMTSLNEAKGQKQSMADLLSQFQNAVDQSNVAEEKANAYKYEYNTSESAEYYQQQLDAINDNLEATAQYQELLNNIAKLEAKQTKQELAGKTLGKSDTKKLEQYYALRESLEKNATAETIAGYTTIYNKWYKLQQKIDSGKKLTTNERKNYNIYSEQLENYANAKLKEVTLLENQIQEAISKFEGDEQKAERQKVADATVADLTAEHEAEVDAIQTKLEATSKYQTLLKNIQKLEEKRAKLEAQGKTLSEKDAEKLEDYYAKKEALDNSATASTINNYIKIYDKWKKLQDKIDDGKTLTKTQQANYDKYSAQLEAYKNEKTTMLADMQSQLDQDIADAYAKANVENTEQSIIDAYDKTAQELKESYEKQIDDADGGLEDSATYQKIVAQIDNKRAELDNLNSIEEDKLTKKQKKRIATLQSELAVLEDQKRALDEGATADNVAEYLKIYNKWKKLDDKLKSGKTLTASQTDNYDKWKAQLEAWTNAKQESIALLNAEMEDALEKLELEKQTQINENAAAVAEAQAQVYELAKQVAEFNVDSIEQEIELLDSLVNSAKSYIELYQTMSKKKLVLAGVIEVDDKRSLADIMEEQYKDAITSTEEKRLKLVDQQKELQDLISAAETNDWDSLFEEYGNSNETVNKLKELLAENEWDGNTWVAEWETALAEVNQEIIDCVNNNQELLDGLREDVYLAGINEAITQLGYLQDTLSSIVGLINDDWLYDDSGNLTTYGTAKVGLLVEQMENAKKEASKYAEEINTIMDMENSYASDKAYQEALENAKKNYMSSLSDLQSYQDSIVDILRKSDEAIINSLKSVIEARKEALAKKKELYEYNKNIQNSQKEIDSIKAQIDALESLSGAMDAATKAKLAQLKADLAEKEDALQETKDEHTYNLQIDALDELLATLEDTMNGATDSVNKSFATYVDAINSAMQIYEANKDYLNEWSNNIISTALGMGGNAIGTDLNLNLGGTGNESDVSNIGVTVSPTDTTTEPSTVNVESETLSNIQQMLQGAVDNGMLVRVADTPLLAVNTDMLNLLHNYVPPMAMNVNQTIPNLIRENKPQTVVNLYYDNLLNVEGNVDKDFAKILPTYLEDSYRYTVSKLNSELNKLH